MGILYVGIDLAKNVFAVHGVNEAGKLRAGAPTVPRAPGCTRSPRCPTCTVAMEASLPGGHHWARLFAAH